jgi:hypothetical protein
VSLQQQQQRLMLHFLNEAMAYARKETPAIAAAVAHERPDAVDEGARG